MPTLLSLVVPMYNEEQNIPLFYDSVRKVLTALPPQYSYELICVNDGSDDATGSLLTSLAKTDDRIRYIEFSRNFGKEIATTAGMHHAQGDVVMLMDADLQHPIELIPEFIARWESGAEMVIGVRKSNSGEGAVKKVGSYLFYKCMNVIAETKTIPNATDYRLMDRKVVNEFNRFTERQRMTRGLLDWLGFKRDYVYFAAAPRNAGTASYNTIKLFRLAMSSFVGNSLFPLKFAGYLGLLTITFSTLLGGFMIIEKYAFNDPFGLRFTGPAILAVAIVFLVGIVLSCLGLIALYIANIHGEVVNRPMYVIRERINIVL